MKKTVEHFDELDKLHFSASKSARQAAESVTRAGMWRDRIRETEKESTRFNEALQAWSRTLKQRDGAIAA